MEETTFNQRMRAVKTAAKEVKQAIKMYTADDVTEVDLKDYKSMAANKEARKKRRNRIKRKKAWSHCKLWSGE